MNSQLLGVTYSEFDNTIGPKLLYTYPLEVMSKERFEEVINSFQPTVFPSISTIETCLC
jgi:hypothetical protein